MATPMHAIDWFEIPVTDFERAKSFYSTILDSDLMDWPMGEVKMAMFPSSMEGGIGGAIVQHDAAVPSTIGTMVYLNAAPDVSIVLDRVEGAGGSVVMPKTQITPEIGYMAIFLDTEGNRVGLHAPPVA